MAIRKPKVAPPAPTPPPRNPDDSVPYGMRVAGAWSWRILLVLGVLAAFVFLVIQLKYIVVPFLVALLVAALLVPFSQWLQRHRWPKWLAVAVSMLGTIAIVTGLIVVVVTQVRRGLPDLQEQSLQAYDDFRAWLLTSPLRLDEQQLNDYVATDRRGHPEGQPVARQRRALRRVDRRACARRHPARAVRDAVHPHRRRPHLGVDRAALPAQGTTGGGWRRSRRLGHPHHLREGADLRRLRRCGRHRRGRVDARTVLRRLPAGDPDRGRGVPRVVRSRRRRAGHRRARGLRRARLPRPAVRRSSCSASCCSCSRSRATSCSRS